MKTLICLCFVLSVVVVTRGMGMNPMDMMKQAADGMKQMMNMFPMMGQDGPPFGDMMKQMENVVGGSGGPEKAMEVFQQGMGKMSETAQGMVQPFMEQMAALQGQDASPEQMMAIMKQMKNAAEKSGK